MRRVLILGGGFGGVATAHALRRRLPPEDEIVVVERRPYFMLGLRKTWALVGRGTLEEGRRPLQALERFGIRVLPGTITAIDPANRAVEVDGRRWEGDAMVVALGAELAPEAIPGFREHALNVYDPQEIPRAMEAVRAFRGGQVMIGIFGAPYKCPPAPYEMAFLLQDFFEARGVRARISVFTPQPMSLPVLGAAGCSVLEGRLAERGIDFLPNHKATAVEAGGGGLRRAAAALRPAPRHPSPPLPGGRGPQRPDGRRRVGAGAPAHAGDPLRRGLRHRGHH